MEALRLNPGLIALIVLSLTDYIRYMMTIKQTKKFHSLFGNMKLVFTVIGLMIVYGIIRNLPWIPFTNLAP